MFEIPDEREGDLSPRVSLNYHFNNENTFRISTATSYRALSTYLYRSNIVSRYTSDHAVFDRILVNRNDVQSEKIISYELAHLISYPIYSFSLDWRLYQDNYSNQIGIALDSTISDDALNGSGIFINAGNYTVSGFQLQAKYDFTNSIFVNFHFSTAEVNGLIKTVLNPPEFDNFNNVVPNETYGVLISSELLNNINLGLNYTHVSSVRWKGLDDITHKYDRLDVNMSSKFKIKKVSSKIELIAYNILKEYKEFNKNNNFNARYIVRFTIEHY